MSFLSVGTTGTELGTELGTVSDTTVYFAYVRKEDLGNYSLVQFQNHVKHMYTGTFFVFGVDPSFN